MNKDSGVQCPIYQANHAPNHTTELSLKHQSHRIRKYKNKNEHRKQRNQHHIQEPKEPNPKPPHIQEANKKGNRNAPNHRTAICNHTIQLKHKTEHHTIQTIDGAHHKR
eukprot:54030_1